MKQRFNRTYVAAEPFHLFRNLDEEAFRSNEREGEDVDKLN